MLELNISDTLSFIKEEEISSYQTKVSSCNKSLYNKTGKGSEYLGWLDLPSKTTAEELEKIGEAADRLAFNTDIIVVIAIGGSYLGARAVIEALSNNFSFLQGKDERKPPLIVYAGQNIDEDYHYDLLNIMDKHDYSLIVISKSGTTTEPAIAFRLLKAHIKKKYGEEKARKKIITVTDKSKGALKNLADSEGYQSFAIPDDAGGRYSVLTPVGLLPIAAAGYNISQLLSGAKEMEVLCSSKEPLSENPADLYAAVRNILYSKGKIIEILACYRPNMHYLTEWWKQLFGESEGKDRKGIFPSGVSLTADLHSMGQLIQDGARNIFETVINVKQAGARLTVPDNKENKDGLNYLAGMRLGEINEKASIGTRLAHTEGGVPNISITLPEVNEFELGGLLYFFEKSCAVSGYLLGVNPFDQPGVEAYKRNMFKLLGKP